MATKRRAKAKAARARKAQRGAAPKRAAYERMPGSSQPEDRRPLFYIGCLIVFTLLSAVVEFTYGLSSSQNALIIAAQVAAMALTAWLLLKKKRAAYAMGAALGFIGLLVLPSAIDNFMYQRTLPFILDSSSFGIAAAAAFFNSVAFAKAARKFRRLG